MNFLSVRILSIALLSLSAVPVLAQETEPVTEQIPTETPAFENKADVSLSKRRNAKKFDAEQWKLEHEQIKEIRANRHNPTEKGLWYSSHSKEEKAARFFSDELGPMVAGGIGYLTLSGEDGRRAAVKGVGALAVQGALVMGIKKIAPKRRPYPNDCKEGTFPSGHASTAFTMAGVLGAAQPSAKIPAYAIAAAVGWSRVKVRAHRWQDVAAGAALGLIVANQFKPDREIRGPFTRLNLRF